MRRGMLQPADRALPWTGITFIYLHPEVWCVKPMNPARGERDQAASGSESGRPNRLIHEKSPYLLQHARNPVDWHPWGEEAFARARQDDKPIENDESGSGVQGYKQDGQGKPGQEDGCAAKSHENTCQESGYRNVGRNEGQCRPPPCRIPYNAPPAAWEPCISGTPACNIPA